MNRMARVRWVGRESEEDLRVPDVNQAATYRVLQDHGDGTVTVEINDLQAAERELQELKDAIDALTLALLETP